MYIRCLLHTQEVTGSSPVSPTTDLAAKCPQFSCELLEKFIASRPGGCSENTFDFYRYALTHFIGYPLSVEGVFSYLKSLTCGNDKARYYQALKTLFLWLYCNGYTQDKIIDRVPTPKVTRKILPAVSSEQLEILLKYCHCERDRALISFLWYSGTRLSEAASVKARDFNWDEETVIMLGKGKKYSKALAGNGLVRAWFENHDSFEISRAGIATMLKRLSKETGIKANPHSFRRGFCVHNVKSGLSIRIVQALSGWESIVMVERYSKSLSFDDAVELYHKTSGSLRF